MHPGWDSSPSCVYIHTLIFTKGKFSADRLSTGMFLWVGRTPENLEKTYMVIWRIGKMLNQTRGAWGFKVSMMRASPPSHPHSYISWVQFFKFSMFKHALGNMAVQCLNELRMGLDYKRYPDILMYLHCVFESSTVYATYFLFRIWDNLSNPLHCHSLLR